MSKHQHKHTRSHIRFWDRPLIISFSRCITPYSAIAGACLYDTPYPAPRPSPLMTAFPKHWGAALTPYTPSSPNSNLNHTHPERVVELHWVPTGFMVSLVDAMMKDADDSLPSICPLCSTSLTYIKRHIDEVHVTPLIMRTLQGQSFDRATDTLWLVLLTARLQRRSPRGQPHPKPAREQSDLVLYFLQQDFNSRPSVLQVAAIREYGASFVRSQAPKLVCGKCGQILARPDSRLRHENSCVMGGS
ncbi:hypothetical protein DL93DRAFT_2074281 [Clavulina sp. PMI_390]|nr:hypothetical protein DL93DRAFT_2074281 [Clavulina sp. PMI_390]